MSETRVALIGMGKMGKALAALAPERGIRVVATIDPAANAGVAINRSSLADAEVAIEFTVPDAAVQNIQACVAAGCPVVVGTTGWYSQLDGVRDQVVQKKGALLYAPNFSIGVAIFRSIVADAARRFASVPGFESHMVETHHSAKKDAPSGTAAMLAGAMQLDEKNITSVRVGSVPGTHEVIFDAPFEQVRLTHEARDRRVFAEGALLAARWLAGRTGVFTMDDVINSNAGGGDSNG